MGILNGKNGTFFGLDIGTSGIRLVQLSHPSNALQAYAYMPIDIKIAMSDSKVDQLQLVQAVKNLVSKSGVRTKNAAVGLPSQKVFTTVVDIEHLSKDELAKTIRLQADSLIPTPIAESKIDWQMLGNSPLDKNKVEVLLSSVPNKYAEERLDLLESIGLNVIAFEPDPLAMVRSLVAPDAMQAQMVLDMGSQTTDLVVVMNGSPRLTRSIPTGYEAIIKAAMQNLNIDDAQARQFVKKFGLDQQKLEGQIYHAIVGTINLLMGEIEKSIKFFSTRYSGVTLERIILAGMGSSLPEFPVYLANKFNINVEIGNAWRNVSYSPERQNELLSISEQFSVAVGLAERKE
jgi:type IV pilus assembly protein PilM